MRSLSTSGDGGDSYLCLSPSFEVFESAGPCDASSIRFKHDVESLDAGLDYINELRPVSFKYNSTDEERLGLIAEEVEDVDPRLVFYEPDGPIRGVRYQDIIPILINAVKELSDKFDQLESQLAAAGQGFGNFVDLIVEKLTAGEVQTEKLCIGETCITESQLRELLDDADVEVPPEEEEEPEDPPVEPEDPPLEPEEPPAEDEPIEEPPADESPEDAPQEEQQPEPEPEEPPTEPAP